ncbi:MAG: sodium:proline symporter, partial [Candidatus Methanomethylophilaceae archaeon]|nr:sodium:proline symporter [Candidatus Methanomethylophilaceae archaeon]
WLLMGLPGAVLLLGIGEAWIGIGLAIGSYLSWLLVAKKLRIHSEVSGNALTVPEYFSNRFNDKKGILRIVAAVIILFFFVIYVASGFK